MTIEAVLAETDRWPLVEQRTLAERLFQRVEARQDIPPPTPELEEELERLWQKCLTDPSSVRRLTREQAIEAMRQMGRPE